MMTHYKYVTLLMEVKSPLKKSPKDWLQNCEPPSTKHYLTVHLKIFKMVNSMLSIFYHNFLNSKKKMSCPISYSNNGWGAVWFSSVQFSRSVVFDSLPPHESQHARPPCPSPSPGVHSDSRPSSK